MKSIHYGHLSSLLLLAVGIALPTNAQVIPDGTVGTTVTQSGLNSTITNGTAAGTNLYHSFGQFSVPTGGSATFDLKVTPTIRTIFSRVTGGSVSTIDGLIRTINSPNPVSLFLLNPAGILFGPNASLNIGGSFVGTTATSIKFADGTDFSAVNPTTPPLLTMSVPIGLQMGSNPAPIQVQGNGNQLTSPGLSFPPIRSATPTGLQVQPGQTLALIGGNIALTGGTLTAEQGQVAIASTGSGLVGLTASSQGWDFDYSGISSFQDIQLSQQSMLDASGIGGGRIQVQGANVSLTDSSILLMQSFGLQPGGGIQVRATDSLNIRGSTADGGISSGLRTIQLGALEGGAIVVEAQRLSLQQGGEIRSDTYGAGSSGMITVKVIDSTELNGLLSQTISSSKIASYTYGSGSAGTVALSTKDLMVLEGAVIASTSLSSGNGGNVTINADGTISIIGVDLTFLQPSNISSVAIGTGNAGNLILNTQQLTIQAGGRIASSTVGRGNAGSVLVNAAKSVEVQGAGTGTFSPSTLESAATIVDPALQQRFNLPSSPSGASGNLILNTPQLSITDGALVSVRNEGMGSGGNLAIHANAIQLDRQGAITASTLSGEGGNIDLQADRLMLRHGSNITATAGGSGNGGNITINAPILLGIENSDIIANAFKGRGGNVQITTQGIIGLQYRPQLTPESDITASSQLGVSGTVQINNIGVDPNAGLVALPANLVDSSQQIATGCAGSRGSSFVATGRGGVPQNPTQQVRDDRTWDDIRDLSAYRQPGKTMAQTPAPKPVLLQATTWHRTADGTVELLSNQTGTTLPLMATCSGADSAATATP